MSKNCTIVLVLKDLPIGGIEEVFFGLAKELINTHVHVELIVLNDVVSEAMLKRFSSLYIRIHVLKNTGFLQKSFHLLKVLSNLSRATHNPVGVISAKEKANFTCAVVKLMAALTLEVRNVKFLATRHVSIKPSVSCGDASWSTQYLYKFYSAVGVKISACSIGLANEVAETCNVKCVPLYNPILGDTFTQRVRDTYHKSSDIFFDESDEVLKISFIGRLVHQKGLDILLDAMKQVSRPFHLIVAGDGIQKSFLQESALVSDISSQKIEFIGEIDNPLSLIRDSDLVIMPSRWEGLPTILIEAVMMKTRVFASDCDFGPREILHPECQDGLFRTGDHFQLAKMIDEFVATRPDERAYEFIMDRFSQANCTKKYLEILF
jgi:glycosyltransferase involved in cell wall biosynthesis